MCGISRVTASNVKCGKSCSKETVEKIAHGLGCSAENLLEKLVGDDNEQII